MRAHQRSTTERPTLHQVEVAVGRIRHDLGDDRQLLFAVVNAGGRMIVLLQWRGLRKGR